MIKTVLIFIVVLFAIVSGLYYFVYAPQQKALHETRREASLSVQEASSLRGRVSDLEATLGGLRQTSAELEARVREKEQELAALRATQEELVGELQKEIAEGQIQVERLRDQLRLDMVDEILFDSGEATLKPGGMEVLRRIGAVLKKGQKPMIIVQGHTDNVPIVGRLARQYPTNWELSAARAVNVTRFLQDKVGLDPSRLSAAEFSEYRPRADNATPQGRQKNRRIEILLGPAAQEPAGAPQESPQRPGA